ncbi:hypothetical protein HB825_05870 [Listeria booriae]|uniref:hypothetical protein n=1 Tax=Listeria booriae TaxID=1552123 RepID=UPI001627E4B8|nr:hypothetical protein [Listeria booriae]MBC1530465.1 hypothetical protein [Listeria booriae]MBC6134360.1 hypothetical protein [Listeria booriae]
MLSIPKKWGLFVSSYLPLYVLLLISFIFDVDIKLKNFFENLSVESMYAIGLILLCLLSVVVLSRLIFFKKGNERISIPDSYKTTGDNVISYIMTYVVPMLSLDFRSLDSILINLLLFICIGVIYVSNNLVYLNPVIALLGYHVYESSSGKIIITKLRIGQLEALKKESTKVMSYRMADDIYIYKKIREKE